MRSLKALSEKRNADEEFKDSRKNYFFHADLAPNSIALLIDTYGLRLPIGTLAFGGSSSAQAP